MKKNLAMILTIILIVSAIKLPFLADSQVISKLNFGNWSSPFEGDNILGDMIWRPFNTQWI